MNNASWNKQRRNHNPDMMQRVGDVKLVAQGYQRIHLFETVIRVAQPNPGNPKPNVRRPSEYPLPASGRRANPVDPNPSRLAAARVHSIIGSGRIKTAGTFTAKQRAWQRNSHLRSVAA